MKKIIIAVYIIINLVTLTRFPVMHSDEAWLSGLSRNILESKSYAVTETFFDLKERHPHAIKLLFHTLQMLFLKLMGYHLFTFRLISLVFGLLTLFFIYRLARSLFSSRGWAWAATVFMALDVQFIYAAHFARQEIIILFFLVLGLWYKFEKDGSSSLKADILQGCFIGLSIGIHPNSFIISLPFGIMYLYDIFFLKKKRLLNLAALMSSVLVFATLFVGISLYLDPDFVAHYSKYGNEFEVFNPISSKLAEVKDFYLKLYYGISGTYYTPNIRFQFFLFVAVLSLSVFKLFKPATPAIVKQRIAALLLGVAAVNGGIILIGRFNQTSIVFVFPFFYMLAVYCLQSVPVSFQKGLPLTLAAILLLITLQNYWPYRDNSYQGYLQGIAKAVPAGAKTLGNLNAEYGFDNGSLLDYRNLAYLKQQGISLEEYIRKNRIEYILYSEELDLIYQLRPKWDGIYDGALDYYTDLQKFLEEDCLLVHRFTDSTYGVRIFRYVDIKNWQVRIYKVLYTD